jgi:hypothetical protein
MCFRYRKCLSSEVSTSAWLIIPILLGYDTVKGKTIPLQALRVPEDEDPRFHDNWHMKAVKLSVFTNGPLSHKDIFLVLISVVGQVAQSVQRLAMGWTVQGSSAGGGAIFRTHPDRPWGPPSLLYNVYRVFHVVKRPGSGADHPPPSSAEVTKG